MVETLGQGVYKNGKRKEWHTWNPWTRFARDAFVPVQWLVETHPPPRRDRRERLRTGNERTHGIRGPGSHALPYFSWTLSSSFFLIGMINETKGRLAAVGMRAKLPKSSKLATICEGPGGRLPEEVAARRAERARTPCARTLHSAAARSVAARTTGSLVAS